jgi:hypothetical protein
MGELKKRFRQTAPPILRKMFRTMPQGAVSAAQAVRDRRMEGAVFPPLPPAPEFSADSLVRRSGLDQDGFRDWPVFWARCGKTRLYGRNLVPLDGEGRVFEEAIFGAQFFNYDDSCIFPTIGKETFLEGRWTSIASRWDNNYWHFLMDALPRLSMLEHFPADTGILVRGPLAGWQRELLEMLGVKARVRETTEKRLLVEDYYFASPTAMTGTWNPAAVAFLRERLLEPVIREQLMVNRHNTAYNSQLTTHKQSPDNHSPITDNRTKLYLKRGASWNRGILNEDEVCSFFEEQGWRVLEPEKLSVKEQIRIFSQAEAVCGLHGSALTNLLWAPPGCRVLELCADNFILGSFEWLARCLNLPHDFLVFSGDSRRMINVEMELLRCSVDKLFRSGYFIEHEVDSH